jgi:predicted DsbA family dithiol-disulfide isomerase
VAFPLHPETPQEGRSLEDLFAGRPVDIPAMLDKLRKVASDLDLPFGDRTMTYNSRSAQELGKWAEAQGKGDAFHHAAFHTYFAEGKNIAEMGVLADLAETAGLSGGEARRVLEEGRYSAAVDADWNRSRQLGITAVPTFLFDGRRLVGAQPYDALARLLEEHHVTRRDEPLRT